MISTLIFWITEQHMKILIPAMIALAAAGCATTNNSTGEVIEADSDSLTFVTWNVEHLAFPPDTGCRPRSQAGIDALRDYARGLDADVVALQEVASVLAAEQLFPPEDWRIVMSGRPDSEPYECRGNGQSSTQQKVAFAVRKPVTWSATRDYDDLGLGMEGLRYGLSITLPTPAGPTEVLNVHLKSGCFVDDYSTSDDEDCEILGQQAAWLDNWVEEKERSNQPYLILGDFNHRLSAPYNRLTRQLTNNADGNPSTTRILTRELIGCHPRYPAPIDHIVAGGELAGLGGGSATVYSFAGEMLSDHCAIAATFAAASGKLSTAVRWHTESKERELITRAAYARAIEAIQAVDTGDSEWVVAMDVDETVLDNSPYQVFLDRTGQSYSSDTWAKWVAQERATPVPGAIEFVRAVFAAGGKVAFITNRNASLDAHTWRNLKSAGFPVTPRNACLLGRTRDDTASTGDPRYVNDKDLRREAVRSGTARCYSGDAKIWQAAHEIVMHVGDNIEDIEGVTQEDANPSALLDDWGTRFIILPNPMYGSWQ